MPDPERPIFERVYGPIVQTEYNMKEFAVRDVDGYVLGFGQEWPPAAETTDA